MHSISIGILRKVIISVGYANISPIKGEINLSLSASRPPHATGGDFDVCAVADRATAVLPLVGEMSPKVTEGVGLRRGQ